MARSYKKHLWCKDANRSKKKGKQIANRSIRRGIRRNTDIPSGGKYRRLASTYDIFDFRTRRTFAEFIRGHQDRYEWSAMVFGREFADERYATDWRELYRNWARYFLWK